MIDSVRLPICSLSALALAVASCGSAAVGDSAGQPGQAEQTRPFRVTPMGRFDEPWAIAFLPGDASALVTQKNGTLILWRAGGPSVAVAGVPPVDHGGQGGLGDVVLSPGFAQDGLVYLTWVEAGPGDTRGPVAGRARLVLEPAPRLEGLEVFWRQTPKVTGRGHFSQRLAFSPDGASLFVASGERQKMTPAQDPTNDLGKILRFIPGKPGYSIVSMGHRNMLGLAFDEAGQLWEVEQGPAGGDELNLVRQGANYGWPEVSEGRHYDGTVIPPHASAPRFAAPALSWNPVIAPGGMIIYRGDLFPQWKGQALIAGLKSKALVRVALNGAKAQEVARHGFDRRIRAVAQNQAGSIWLLEDGPDGRLLRLSPEPGVN